MEKDSVFEELKNIIGEDAAKRFVEHYAGSNLYTPKKIILEVKRLKIIEGFKRGAGYRELARRSGYTERHIRRIIHKERSKYRKNNA